MKNLFIIGASGFGRELHAWIKHHPDYAHMWQFAAFLDDNKDALRAFDDFAQVRPLEGHLVLPQNIYLCGLGLPAVKQKLLAPIISQGAIFLTFIHPTAILGERVKLGRGVVLCPGASVSVDISIGDYAMIGPNTTIGHDATIGSWSTLCAQCDITGRVIVGGGVFMGSRVSVIPSRRVGNNSIVGAGAVVISDVPEGVTVVGNPARVL